MALAALDSGIGKSEKFATPVAAVRGVEVGPQGWRRNANGKPREVDSKGNENKPVVASGWNRSQGKYE